MTNELKLKIPLNKYFFNLNIHISIFFVVYYNTTAFSYILVSRKSTLSKKKATTAKKNTLRWSWKEKVEHIQKRKCLIHGTLQLWITVCPTTRQFQLGECKINSATKNYPAVPQITLCQNEYIVPRENPTNTFNHLNWKAKQQWRHQKEKEKKNCFQKVSKQSIMLYMGKIWYLL